MVEAARMQSAPAFAQADMKFHSLFYELSGNSRLGLFWSQIKPTF